MWALRNGGHALKFVIPFAISAGEKDRVYFLVFVAREYEFGDPNPNAVAIMQRGFVDLAAIEKSAVA